MSPKKLTPPRDHICAHCREYGGAKPDGLGDCYLHGLSRYPFDACEHFKREESDGYIAGEPRTD